ncbi:MAG TPA: hypothetical protein DEF74_00190, partial [Pseudoalteromonas sp.]|nr:hypothetical protein [Pseudoalteromonas sp.]
LSPNKYTAAPKRQIKTVIGTSASKNEAGLIGFSKGFKIVTPAHHISWRGYLLFLAYQCFF